MEQEPKKRGRKKKPDDLKRKPRSIYATDTEWNELSERAEKAGKEVGPYIIDAALAAK